MVSQVKSNDVTYNVIGGRGQRHGPLEVENMAIFQSYLLPWESGYVVRDRLRGAICWHFLSIYPILQA